MCVWELTAPRSKKDKSGYLSVTYSSVTSARSSNNGDVYRCNISFNSSPEISSDADRTPPSFNFTWTSSPPLNVQCENTTLFSLSLYIHLYSPNMVDNYTEKKNRKDTAAVILFLLVFTPSLPFVMKFIIDPS